MSINCKQQIDRRINEAIEAYLADNGNYPQYIMMDNNTYFAFKICYYGGDEYIAAMEEVEEYNGLKVFYNALEYDFLKVAG